VAGTTALLCSLVASLWYNALVTPLCFALLSYALIWRNQAVRADTLTTEEGA
jgi:hypothetical protein